MTNYSNEVWNQLQQFYKDKFDTEPELVEIASVIEVLRLCASGTATWKIAKFLGLELGEVENVLDKYLGLDGWVFDLNYNPLRIYKNLEEKNLENYTDFIARCGLLQDAVVEQTYKAAELVYSLERLIDENWI